MYFVFIETALYVCRYRKCLFIGKNRNAIQRPISEKRRLRVTGNVTRRIRTTGKSLRPNSETKKKLYYTPQ